MEGGGYNQDPSGKDVSLVISLWTSNRYILLETFFLKGSVSEISNIPAHRIEYYSAVSCPPYRVLLRSILPTV